MCWTLYCKCTNFQANHNAVDALTNLVGVGLYIANVLTFKRITTAADTSLEEKVLDSILQMY